jgi:hypothetical protein
MRLVMKCREFEDGSTMFGRPFNVSSRVSLGNSGIFIDSIAG